MQDLLHFAMDFKVDGYQNSAREQLRPKVFVPVHSKKSKRVTLSVKQCKKLKKDWLLVKN